MTAALRLLRGRRRPEPAAGRVCPHAAATPEPVLAPVRRRARVIGVGHLAPDAKSFVLASADGRPLPPPTPGAHIDIHPLPGVVRQYSLCNGPGDSERYVIAVRRDSASRGGSRALHDLVTTGDELEISEPRSHFALEREAASHLLLTRGIGLAGVISMAQTLAASGASFRLEHFARSPEHVLFKEILAEPHLAPNVGLHQALEPEAEGACLQGLLAQRPPGAHLYVCGPPAFMDLVLALAEPAWPRFATHCEYFNANPRAWAGERRGFAVKLARSGRTVHVPPELSIATALAMAGVDVETACEQGVCRTCLTRVVAGEPDHRDAVLSPLERERGDRMLICVSRAAGDEITLDL